RNFLQISLAPIYVNTIYRTPASTLHTAPGTPSTNGISLKFSARFCAMTRTATARTIPAAAFDADIFLFPLLAVFMIIFLFPFVLFIIFIYRNKPIAKKVIRNCKLVSLFSLCYDRFVSLCAPLPGFLQ